MLKNKPQPRRGAPAGVTKSLGMAGKALGRKAPVAKPGGLKAVQPTLAKQQAQFDKNMRQAAALPPAERARFAKQFQQAAQRKDPSTIRPGTIMGKPGSGLGAMPARRTAPPPITPDMQKQIRDARTTGFRGTPQGPGRSNLKAIGAFNKLQRGKSTMTKSKGPGGLTRLTRRGKK